MKRRVYILGAGVCGLAAALRLYENDPHVEVTLLEAGDRPGGLARSLTLGGQTADMGPHRIHTELPDVKEFLEDLAGEDMERVTRKSRMWLRGRWIQYPPKPFEILRLLGPFRVAGTVLSFIGEKLKSGKRKDNFETVMTSAFGSQLYRLIVLGYTKKVWKTDPREIHGDIARVRVSAGGLDQMIKRVFIPEKEGEETALKKFYYIPGGVEKLATKMVERLDKLGAKIRLNATVTDLQPLRTGHWRLTWDENGEESRSHADLVISTMPVTDLVDILDRHNPKPKVMKARKGLRFLANFLVCVVVNKPQVTDCQWLYFPGKDTIFNRGYEPKNFSDKMGKSGQCMIMLEITCHHGGKIWNASDKVLIKKTIEGLERTGLVKPSDVAETMVHRITHTYPMYDLDYRNRLDKIWKYLEEFPNLISTGRQGLFLHNNMDHSIHMGFRAADVAQKEAPEAPQEAFYKEVRRFQKFRIVD